MVRRDGDGSAARRPSSPVRTQRCVFQWRRIDRIREEYSKQEIVDALGDTLEQIEDYRAQFDAEHPDEVSLVDATREQNLSTEAAWKALSEWESLERRAALLDAARRNNPVAGSKPGPLDTEILDRIAANLARSDRFDDIQTRPAYAPTAVVADYDLGHFPGGVTRAYLRIRWFETDDFSIHYSPVFQTSPRRERSTPPTGVWPGQSRRPHALYSS